MRTLTEVGRPRGETDWKLEMENSVLAMASLRSWSDIHRNISRQLNWPFAPWSSQGWIGSTRK